ncbi:hypothetical protein Efla_005835 [Eimeria flavescens]
MARRSFSPLEGDDAAALSRSAAAAASALEACGWWAAERVAATTAATEHLGSSSSSSSRSGLLPLADLCDSAAEHLEGLVRGKVKALGSIYSGDAGLAYLLIRQGLRLLVLLLPAAAAAAAAAVASWQDYAWKAERLLAEADREPRFGAAKEPGAAAGGAFAAAAAASAATEATAASEEAEGSGLDSREAAGRAARPRKAAERALQEALEILSLSDTSHETEEAARGLRRRFTFLQGHEEAFAALRRLAAAAAAAASRLEAAECELLYGRAGLLHAILFTRGLWLPPPAALQGPSHPSCLLEQQEQEQQAEAGDIFGDCDEDSSSSSSSSSGAGNLKTAASLGAASQSSSVGSCGGSSGSVVWPPPSPFGSRSNTLLSSFRSSSSSMPYVFGSEILAHDRLATRVLLLSLTAQLVGQLVAQGRVGAVVARGGRVGYEHRDLEEALLQPGAAAAVAYEAFASGTPLLPLVYEWHGKEYLGAAHGLCGILLQLLQAVETLHHAAACGCFPGPAGGQPAAAKGAFAAAAAAAADGDAAEEAKRAAARLLTCAPAVCSTMKRGGREGSIFCAAASAFLCCSDAVGAAAALRDSVRRLCLVSVSVLLRRHLTEASNLKSSIGSSRDVLVQWCHGAPGFLPLLCWAVDIHAEAALQQQLLRGSSSADGESASSAAAAPQQQQHQQQQQQKQEQRQSVGLYRRKSRRATDVAAAAREDAAFFLDWLNALGRVTWRRGLLTKGLGLCHGVGGNGLSLLSAFRTTQQPRWLRRALLFALEGIKRQQQLLSVPDRPFSLFEGAAGFAVFLRDCAEALRAACCPDRPTTFYFPGYELPPLLPAELILA